MADKMEIESRLYDAILFKTEEQRTDHCAICGHDVRLSVSNSWSGGDGELDEVPAVRDPAHIVQIGRNHRVLTGEGQRRVALQ